MARVTAAAVQTVWRTGAPDGSVQRAWTFDFDGHTFYVLDLGNVGCYLYDLNTGVWTQFDSMGFAPVWNFRNGMYWQSGKITVGAGNVSSVFRLDPSTFIEEGWRPVNYELTGLLSTSDHRVLRQYALRTVASAGRLTDGPPVDLQMQFSDDQGATWSAAFTVTLTSSTRQRIEFPRGLGAFAAPGRIFGLVGGGGGQCLGYVVAEVEGGEGRCHSRL